MSEKQCHFLEKFEPTGFWCKWQIYWFFSLIQVYIFRVVRWDLHRKQEVLRYLEFVVWFLSCVNILSVSLEKMENCFWSRRQNCFLFNRFAQHSQNKLFSFSYVTKRITSEQQVPVVQKHLIFIEKNVDFCYQKWNVLTSVGKIVKKNMADSGIRNRHLRLANCSDTKNVYRRGYERIFGLQLCTIWAV